MNWLPQDPFAAHLLESAAILVGSYLAARILAVLFGKLLSGLVRRTTTTVDDRLIGALRGPVTYALFLLGAYVALHHLPIHDAWTRRLDGALFVLAVALLGLGISRAYGIVVNWYTWESRAGAAGGVAREFGPLFAKLGKIFIAVFAAIVALDHFGLDAKSLVVSLGVGSLAIGLAAQDTLSNMFAGFALMLDRPFAIGDRVQLPTGEVGDVEAIGMRATRILTTDGTLLVVPNSSLVKDRLINLSKPGRQILARVDVGAPFGTDPATVKTILVEAARSSPLVDTSREAVAVLRQFGDSALLFRVAFWARDYNEQGLAVGEVHEEIVRRFAAAGIDIPFPTRRIIREEDE